MKSDTFMKVFNGKPFADDYINCVYGSTLAVAGTNVGNYTCTYFILYLYIQVKKKLDEEQGYIIFTEDELEGLNIVPLDVFNNVDFMVDTKRPVTSATNDSSVMITYFYYSPEDHGIHLGLKDAIPDPNTEETKTLRIDAKAEFISQVPFIVDEKPNYYLPMQNVRNESLVVTPEVGVWMSEQENSIGYPNLCVLYFKYSFLQNGDEWLQPYDIPSRISFDAEQPLITQISTYSGYRQAGALDVKFQNGILIRKRKLTPLKPNTAYNCLIVAKLR